MIASTMQGMTNIYKKNRVFGKAAFLYIFIMDTNHETPHYAVSPASCYFLPF